MQDKRWRVCCSRHDRALSVGKFYMLVSTSPPIFTWCNCCCRINSSARDVQSQIKVKTEYAKDYLILSPFRLHASIVWLLCIAIVSLHKPRTA